MHFIYLLLAVASYAWKNSKEEGLRQNNFRNISIHCVLDHVRLLVLGLLMHVEEGFWWLQHLDRQLHSRIYVELHSDSR